MKKILPLAAILCLAAFTFATNDAQKSFATVNQNNGLYIFSDCRPNSEYEVLGTLYSKRVNIDLKSFEGYTLTYDQLKEEMFRQMGQKKNKKKYEPAEGIIIYADQQKADVIKFK